MRRLLCGDLCAALVLSMAPPFSATERDPFVATRQCEIAPLQGIQFESASRDCQSISERTLSISLEVCTERFEAQ